MVTIKDIFNITKGIKVDSVLDKAENNSLRYIQIEDLRDNNVMKYTLDTDLTQVNETDLVIAWDGANAGTIGFGLKGVIGSTLARLSLKEQFQKKYNSIYLGYFLSTKFEYFQNTSTGATIPHVSKTALEVLPVPFPDIETQNKIVAILDKSKAILDKREETLSKYDVLLRMTFLEMFGDPVLNKKNWERKTIQRICKNIVDCPHTTPTYLETESDFPCIRTSEIKNGDIVWESMKYLSEDSYLKRISRLKPEENDIIFGREGTVGEALIIPSNLNISLGQRVMLFRVDKEQISPLFFWTQMISKGIQFEISRKIIGATVKRINIGDLIQIKFIIPPIELQNEFTNRIEKILALKRKVKAFQMNSNKLLKSLSQLVFSERIIIDVEAEMEALINAIDLEKKDEENKIETIKNDLTFLQRLIDKLQERDFENSKQYEKAKYIVFRIMKEEPNLIKQEFNRSVKEATKKKINLQLQ